MSKLTKEQYDNLDKLHKEYLTPSNVDFITSKETHPELYTTPSMEAVSLLIRKEDTENDNFDYEDLEQLDEEFSPRELDFDKRAFQMLKDLRKKHHYSIKNLRELLEKEHGIAISQPAITKWEKQGIAPREEIQNALASIYNFNSRYEFLEFLMNSYRVTPVIAKIRNTDIANFGKDAGLEINRLKERINELEAEAHIKRIKLFSKSTDIYGCNLLNSGTLINKKYGWISAPPIIEKTHGCFAIRLVNDEMAPRYMTGDLIFVDSKAQLSEGDDVVLVLKYPEEKKMVAICRTLTELIIDEADEEDENPRLFGHFGFASQEMYYEAHVAAERELVHGEYGSKEIDPSKFFDDQIKQNTLSLGIWEDYKVQGMSNTDGRKMIIGDQYGYEKGDIIPDSAAIYKVVCSYRKPIEANNLVQSDEFIDFGDFSGVVKFK